MARMCCHVFVLVVHTHVTGQTSVGSPLSFICGAVLLSLATSLTAPAPFFSWRHPQIKLGKSLRGVSKAWNFDDTVSFELWPS